MKLTTCLHLVLNLRMWVAILPYLYIMELSTGITLHYFRSISNHGPDGA